MVINPRQGFSNQVIEQFSAELYKKAYERVVKETVENTSCCGSQFSGSRISRFSESFGRNNGIHIDVQRLRHAHEWSGTG